MNVRGVVCLLLGAVGVVMSVWGSAWVVAAACRGVLSLTHLAAAAFGLVAARYGLGRWEACAWNR
ncbi:hypothetical protein BACT_0518 [Bifidobacterium actinocoloniiforme DSM 22766]|uniref:Uncharacterized protein n=1 Tax=Bifidobacterium actinocoloniiforme DSM 22766 TaxID=1437605 RepID=A0A086YZW7_9BIFI|nr:hypothetical protein [Bifidobacterium actinocoloniiforme]AKV55097.1 hypothetical protein AB656_01195 [Bifidobacterium actinocoloniiforme DSM 22766]KFI39817.1 hypothetical protein BACT_0518 [Bifidobacterium actinocoloniiforme DSM 22766]